MKFIMSLLKAAPLVAITILFSVFYDSNVDADSIQQVFENPTLFGRRLDRCVRYSGVRSGEDCNQAIYQEVADSFCKHKDFQTAIDWRGVWSDNLVSVVRLLKIYEDSPSGEVYTRFTWIDESGGNIFTSITCQKDIWTDNACFIVSSQQGWQYFNFPGTFSRITSIEGFWSVDDLSYPRVGAQGHIGESADRLAPYNQYKYDQNYPFGRLLVDIPNYGYLSVSSPQSLPRSINSTAMRINDGDNALGDNGGSLRVCFGH